MRPPQEPLAAGGVLSIAAVVFGAFPSNRQMECHLMKLIAQLDPVSEFPRFCQQAGRFRFPAFAVPLRRALA
jgi:hypothetical protein